jgi:hypothetical protein
MTLKSKAQKAYVEKLVREGKLPASVLEEAVAKTGNAALPERAPKKNKAHKRQRSISSVKVIK